MMIIETKDIETLATHAGGDVIRIRSLNSMVLDNELVDMVWGAGSGGTSRVFSTSFLSEW